VGGRVDDAVALAAGLINQLGVEHEASPLVAAAAMFLAVRAPSAHPQTDQIRDLAVTMLLACAAVRGIEPEAALDWVTAQGLADPAVFIPMLDDALEAIVGPDGWLLDRSVFPEFPG
jgi:hypothetical protein